MRVLHIADVHLDRPFVGLPPKAAAERRRELWQAFRRCLELAQERNADLVTIGGDLWEEENVTANTRQSVAFELGQLPQRVLIICGNHDPYLPGGNYARTDWPENVHLFTSSQLSACHLDEVTIWGASWTGGDLEASFLESFAAPEDGRSHLLLLHGTAQLLPYFSEAGGYCQFDPARVLERGFAACLAGHVHSASDQPGVIYPGSPEPLGWGEPGRHGCALIDVGPSKALTTELIEVATRRYEHRTVDCTGASASAAVEAALEKSLNDAQSERLCIRASLTGEVTPECEIDPDLLASAHSARYAALVVVDETTSSYDLETLAKQSTARGRFVRRLLDEIGQAADPRERDTLQSALTAGLRALDGRKDVV